MNVMMRQCPLINIYLMPCVKPLPVILWLDNCLHSKIFNGTKEASIVNINLYCVLYIVHLHDGWMVERNRVLEGMMMQS